MKKIRGKITKTATWEPLTEHVLSAIAVLVPRCPHCDRIHDTVEFHPFGVQRYTYSGTCPDTRQEILMLFACGRSEV